MEDPFGSSAVRGKVPSLPSPCQLNADETFADDLSEQEKKFFWATRFAPAADLFTQKLDGVAWRSKPSSSVVARAGRRTDFGLVRCRLAQGLRRPRSRT